MSDFDYYARYTLIKYMEYPKYNIIYIADFCTNFFNAVAPVISVDEYRWLFLFCS